MFNSRVVNDELNIFSGLKKNVWFIMVWLGEVAISVIIIEFSGRVFNLCKQGLVWHQWLIALAFATFLLVYRVIITKLPEKCFPRGERIERVKINANS